MRNNAHHDPRAFVLTTASVYVPGSLPKQVEAASTPSGGGCCGSASNPSQEDASGCGTSECDTAANAPQRTRCC